MGTVALQRAFDLSATFPLTLRSKTPATVTDEDAASAWRLSKRRWFEPRRAWLRRHGRRPAPSPTVTYQVPPLTLGRFLDLMSSDWHAVAAPLLGSTLIKVEGKDPAEIIGRQLAGIDHRAFTGPVCAVVPGMTAAVWEESGDCVQAMLLLDYFHKAHDWPLIAKAIGWGTTVQSTATKATVAAALMSFCRAFPTQSVPDLLATRIEGFFYLRDGATETMKASRSPEEDDDGESADILAHEGPIAAGHGLISDPDRKSSLWDSIDAADKAVQ